MNLETTFRSAAKFMKKEFHDICDAFADMRLAICNPRVLKASTRHLDEAKMFAGIAALAEGASVFNPLIAGGGAVSLWEGAHDLAAAGHKWRLAHAHRPARASAHLR